MEHPRKEYPDEQDIFDHGAGRRHADAGCLWQDRGTGACTRTGTRAGRGGERPEGRDSRCSGPRSGPGPGSDEPGSDEPGSDEPGSNAPGGNAPGSNAPETRVPGTKAAETNAPDSDKPHNNSLCDNKPCGSRSCAAGPLWSAEALAFCPWLGVADAAHTADNAFTAP